jgi:hypothetical protein
MIGSIWKKGLACSYDPDNSVVNSNDYEDRDRWGRHCRGGFPQVQLGQALPQQVYVTRVVQ